MLNIYRKGAVTLAAAALTFAATVAQADRHVVLIVQGSYFPSKVFALPGDTIEFQNKSGASHVITGGEAETETEWTSGDIAAEGLFELEIVDETPATFSGSGGGFEIAYGEFIFQPPLEEQ